MQASKLVILNRETAEELLDAFKQAKRLNHRIMLVLTGDNDGNLIIGAVEAINLFLSVTELKGEGILYAYHAFYEDGRSRKEVFEKAVKHDTRFVYVSYHDSEMCLGRTFDAAILDLINNLEPNDVGRLSGVVKGGGLYVILLPSFQRLMKIITRFQGLLLTPQYGPESLRKFFERRFVSKLFVHEGVIVYDVDEKKILKYSDLPKQVPKAKREDLVIPEKKILPQPIYEIAVTQDQVNVLKILEKLYQKPEKEKKVVIVITADRGRGKSSVIGLGIAALSHKIRRAKGRCAVVLTAPSEANVQELFKFARRGLESLGYEVQAEEEGGYITRLKAKSIDIAYFRPLEAVTKRADIVAVDEAASLQVPMLFAILKKHDRVIYSSTVHGYEGAGRGFSIRFLHSLRQSKNIEIYEYEMKEPIRYALEDPIELWAFDTLLLDAEPSPITEDDLKLVEEGEVEYWIPDPEEFFLKDENTLREFFGIYIMAHYRNNPNDLGMMMDAPHHKVRALRLKNGKVVVSIELAEEGPLEEELAKQSARGAWIMGNIIPDRLIKHYKLVDFGRYKGLRIVRIATHPDLWGKGLGSRALEELEKEAIKVGYDWVGAGFGVTLELLKFWLKNNYLPVHLSPDRNPVSGEYTALVIKPLNERVKEYIDRMAIEFKRKLLSSLAEPYHDLSPRVIRAILSSTPGAGTSPKLTEYQLGRLVSYAWGDMTLENCMDCMRELAEAYFMNGYHFLDEEQELLLITKVLQAKSWKVTCLELDTRPSRAMDSLRSAAKALCSELVGIRSEKDIERFLFLKLEG